MLLFRKEPLLKALFFVLFFGLSSSCGYSFRTSKVANPWPGVRKIYVPVFKNKSLYHGAEAAFTKSLVTRMNSTGRWIVTNSREDADAIVLGTISDSGSVVMSVTGSATLPGCESTRSSSSSYSCPEEDIPSEGNALIVNQYNASVRCHIQVIAVSELEKLEKQQRGEEQDIEVLFSKSFERAEAFSAANRKGRAGSTNSLINLSRRDLVFSSISETLMEQAVAMMLQAF